MADKHSDVRGTMVPPSGVRGTLAKNIAINIWKNLLVKKTQIYMAKKKKSNAPRILVFTAVALLAVVVAGSKWGWFGDGGEQKVAVDSVREKTIFELVSASGKVKPEFEVKLSSEVSGEIIELHVKEGDVVRKGQILCRVRPDLLQSGYDRVAAAVRSSRF